MGKTDFVITADDKQSGISPVKISYNGLSCIVHYDKNKKIWFSQIHNGFGVYKISVKNLLGLEYNETRKIICIGGNSPNFVLSEIFGLAI